MKYKEKEKETRAMELLKQFPPTIHHPKLDYLNDLDHEDCSVGWKPENSPWHFSLTRTENSGWRICYELWGYEGPEESLPITSEAAEEAIRTMIPPYHGGLEGSSLEDLIFELWGWLEKEGLLS